MAIFLTTTGDLIQVVTGGAQGVAVRADYIDQSSGPTFTAGRQSTSISSAATTTVVSPPAGSTTRNLKFLSLRNTDASASVSVAIQTYDGTTAVPVWQATLLAGWTVQYDDLAGFILLDAAGARAVSPLVGRFLKSTVLPSGTSFTTSPSTNTVKLRGVGGGGAGGGVSAAAANGPAGGGGAGSYLEKTFAATPNTAYAYTVGAGGTGVSGGAGNNGGSSTFVNGGTTYTCNGGTGGPLVTSSANLLDKVGGAGGVVSTNGDLNATGDNGQNGVTALSAAGVSGSGGSSPFGGGGAGLGASGNGNAAGGFGAGGGGGLSDTAAARTGGNGAGGCWVVDEYS